VKASFVIITHTLARTRINTETCIHAFTHFQP
jgi:hypothetical protein